MMMMEIKDGMLLLMEVRNDQTWTIMVVVESESMGETKIPLFFGLKVKARVDHPGKANKNRLHYKKYIPPPPTDPPVKCMLPEHNNAHCLTTARRRVFHDSLANFWLWCVLQWCRMNSPVIMEMLIWILCVRLYNSLLHHHSFSQM